MLPGDLKANPRLDHWVRFEPKGRVTVLSGKVELGQGAVTAIAQIAAEELGVKLERVTMVAGDTSRSPDEGYTSGSQSMESGGTAMRVACAEVRQLFLIAAARRLEVNVDELEVDDGAIRVPGTDLRTDYWTLSGEVSLARDSSGEVKLRNTTSIVGKSQPRLDLAPKLSGAAYVHDMELPRMLHGRILRPASYDSRLESFEKQKILDMPGVVAVVVDGSFVGVCAEREEQALKAVEAAASLARWTKGSLREPKAIAELLPTLKAETTVLSSKKQPASSMKRLEAMYSRPYIAHASIGPSCAVAEFKDRQLTVWTHSQGTFHLRDQIARTLGMLKEDVTCIHRDGPGCYGHNGADDVALDAALLARACGRPIRVVWSREDEFAWSPFGSAMAVKCSAALDASGYVADWKSEVWSHPHSSRPGTGPGVNLLAAWHLERPQKGPTPKDPPFPPGGGARNAVPLYEFPSQEVIYHLVSEQVIRVSALRALGAHANVYAIESFMDELAHAAGADPVEFRLRHLADPRAKAVIEAAAKAAGWKKPSQGIGFAKYKNSSAYCAVVVEVEAEAALRVKRVWAAVDAGQVINPDGLRNQIEGGIVQAASWTLKEAVRWDRERVVVRSWEDYPILKFDEVPEMNVYLVQSQNPWLGAGECAAGPAAAAIGNALFSALGVRARHLPLTPERIAEAMQ